jgi:sugar phosphate isomerase/epimerase
MKDIYLITASFVGEIQRDFRGYLDMTRRAGYRGIELFRCPYDQYSPKDFRAVLEEYGLTAISAHVDIEDTEKMLGYLPETGARFIVCPGLRVGSREEAYEKAGLLNELGRKAKAAGLRYGYHNHNNDFDRYGDETVIDILLKNTDPELVTFELDAAWAWRAGVNAAEFVEAHAGRFDLIHVKETARALGPEDDLKHIFAGARRGPDGRPILTPEMKAVFEEHQKINCKLGDGIINMPQLKKAADAQGVQAYIVEREYAYTGDNFTTILADREYLSALE